MYKTPLIIVSFVTVILAVMVFTLQMQLAKAPKASAYDMVYAACQVSRQTDKIQESTCGDLQDYYNVEYMCEKANALATNTCWVEVK